MPQYITKRTDSFGYIEYEENYASAHGNMKTRLFLTAGSEESDVLEPLRRMLACLQSRMYPSLELITHVFEDKGHLSTYAASVSRALFVLYCEDIRKD
jgi:hypothetical protein